MMTQNIRLTIRIEENTFAAACLDQNSIADLEEALAGNADHGDMDAWGITPEEWRSQIELALTAKREDAQDKA